MKTNLWGCTDKMSGNLEIILLGTSRRCSGEELAFDRDPQGLEGFGHAEMETRGKQEGDVGKKARGTGTVLWHSPGRA